MDAGDVAIAAEFSKENFAPSRTGRKLGVVALGGAELAGTRNAGDPRAARRHQFEAAIASAADAAASLAVWSE